MNTFFVAIIAFCLFFLIFFGATALLGSISQKRKEREQEEHTPLTESEDGTDDEESL